MAVDLDGQYPNQKMTLYVPAKDDATAGTLSPEGATGTATGTTIQYHGKPEIKIFQASRWKW